MQRSLPVRTVRRFIVHSFISVMLGTLVLASIPPRYDWLRLVSVRDHIPGSFTTGQSVYATPSHIYLASYQGTLFVLKRSKTENFPLVQTLNIGSPLTGVRGFGDQLFVTSVDGFLRQYSTTNPLTLVRSVPLSTYGLSSIAVFNETVYVARGQGSLAVDGGYVYLAQLNEGDTAMALDNQLQITKTYGSLFESDVTVVYERRSGARTTALANPMTVFNVPGFPRLFTFGENLFQTVGGCCGAEVLVTPNQTFANPRVIPQTWVNAVSLNANRLIVGDEAGKVSLYSFTSNSFQFRKALNLPIITNHTNPEDIEIRSVWSDSYDNLVFAASSWGNTGSQSPTLPSFFVLEMGNPSMLATVTSPIDDQIP